MSIFPVVRSVRVAKELPEGISAQALVSTSQQSWAETDLKTLQEGRSTFDAGSDRQGPVSIAAVATMVVQKQEDKANKTTAEDKTTLTSQARRGSLSLVILSLPIITFSPCRAMGICF